MKQTGVLQIGKFEIRYTSDNENYRYVITDPHGHILQCAHGSGPADGILPADSRLKSTLEQWLKHSKYADGDSNA